MASVDWSTKPVPERLAAAEHGLAPIMQKYESAADDDAQIRSLADSALAILETHCLSYYQQAPPDNVGVHSTNRWGSGVVPVDVHAKIRNICSVGFSPAACADACATETPPGVAGEKELDFNKRLVKNADGLLAEIKSDSSK